MLQFFFWLQYISTKVWLCNFFSIVMFCCCGTSLFFSEEATTYFSKNISYFLVKFRNECRYDISSLDKTEFITIKRKLLSYYAKYRLSRHQISIFFKKRPQNLWASSVHTPSISQFLFHKSCTTGCTFPPILKTLLALGSCFFIGWN